MAGTQFGGYASRSPCQPTTSIPLPDRLTFEQGAAIPVNYATAWAGLIGYGSLRAGERVLIQAAAGGVGTSATQIAKRVGAEVWGTASPGKHDAIRANGVDHARRLPQGRLVGGAAAVRPRPRRHRRAAVPALLQDAARRRAVGRLRRLVGVHGREAQLREPLPEALPMLRGFNLINQMQESKAVIGLNMLTLWKDRGTLEPWIGPLAELIEDGTVQPLVSDAVPFDNAADAHRIIARAPQCREGRAHTVKRLTSTPRSLSR